MITVEQIKEAEELLSKKPIKTPEKVPEYTLKDIFINLIVKGSADVAED